MSVTEWRARASSINRQARRVPCPASSPPDDVHDSRPCSDDPAGMASAWLIHVGRPLPSWSAHLRAAVAERTSDLDFSPRCTAAMVACDAHVADCDACTTSRVCRGFASPSSAECAASERLRGVAATAAEDLSVALSSPGDGYGDPSMCARAHRWSCPPCREWCTSRYDALDPDTWLDPSCVTGIVLSALTAACPPLTWLLRQDQDQSRTPAHARRRCKMTPGDWKTTVVVNPNQIRDPRSTESLAAYHAALGLMTSSSDRPNKARLVARLPAALTRGGPVPPRVPPRTFAHPTRTTAKLDVWGASPGDQPQPAASLTVPAGTPVAWSTAQRPGSSLRLVQQMNYGLNTVTSGPSFRFQSVPQWFAGAPRGCHLMSMDESAAYHCIFISKADRPMMSFTVVEPDTEQVLVVEPSVCGFGFTAAPALYAAIKSAIVGAINCALAASGLPASCTAYLDDTAAYAPRAASANVFAFATNAIRAHGMTVNESKSSPPSPFLDHTGISLDTSDGSMGLTPAKFAETSAILKRFAASSATPKVWASVLGKLRSLGAALGPSLGLGFFGMWSMTRPPEHADCGTVPQNRCPRPPPPSGVVSAASVLAHDADLRYSVAQLSKVTALRFTLPSYVASSTVVMTDASDTGAGAVVALGDRPLVQLSAALGPRHNDGTSSVERELMAPLIALSSEAVAAKSMAVIVTDSQGAAAVINSRRGRTLPTARTIAGLLGSAKARRIEPCALWLPREATLRADVLSRVSSLAPNTFLAARRLVATCDELLSATGVPVSADSTTSSGSTQESAATR